jgi:hypothetical protein
MLHDRRLRGEETETGEKAAGTPIAVVSRERIGPALVWRDFKVFMVHASLATGTGEGDLVAVGFGGTEREG